MAARLPLHASAWRSHAPSDEWPWVAYHVRSGGAGDPRSRMLVKSAGLNPITLRPTRSFCKGCVAIAPHSWRLLQGVRPAYHALPVGRGELGELLQGPSTTWPHALDGIRRRHIEELTAAQVKQQTLIARWRDGAAHAMMARAARAGDPTGPAACSAGRAANLEGNELWRRTSRGSGDGITGAPPKTLLSGERTHRCALASFRVNRTRHLANRSIRPVKDQSRGRQSLEGHRHGRCRI